MDRATIVGIIAGIAFLLLGILSGGTIGTFINVQSLLITFGGTFGSLFIAFSWEQVLNVGKTIKNAFTTKATDPKIVIGHVVVLSEKARREGLLSLEKELSDINNLPFLVKGVQLVVDGSEQEIVHTIMETERDYIEDRHKLGIAMLDQLAAFAPAWGMIGTIIGLILMLKTLEDPSAVGPAMATALLTTFYGALAAFFIFTPIGNKLKIRSQQELMVKDIMIQGILAIQGGDNPRMVKEKLTSFLAPKEKSKMEENGQKK